jgi:hypothetical protein
LSIWINFTQSGADVIIAIFGDFDQLSAKIDFDQLSAKIYLKPMLDELSGK